MISIGRPPSSQSNNVKTKFNASVFSLLLRYKERDYDNEYDETTAYHNLFDIKQYEYVRDNLDIPVFPGVEVDLENGYILIITSEYDIYDFEE